MRFHLILVSSPPPPPLSMRTIPPSVQNATGPECRQCSAPCAIEFATCTGLPGVTNLTVDDDGDGDDASQVPNEGVIVEYCNDFDLESIDAWYGVYGIRFIQSIKDAWNGDAKLLAVIIVLFSGLWPYVKSIIVLVVWYLPMTVGAQRSVLLWLARLSKYTLVDVFALIALFVGVQLQLDIGGTEAVTRAEPRLGLIAFFWATVWQYLQIEVVRAMHERAFSTAPATTSSSSSSATGQEGERGGGGGDRLFFEKLWMPALVLVASLALFVAGAVTEIVIFTSVDSSGVCSRSYNLVSLVGALLSEISMTGSSVPAQTWSLFVNYVILILAFPVVTHLLQIAFIVGRFRSRKMNVLSEGTMVIWYFTSIEPLLIGVFAVEYKVRSRAPATFMPRESCVFLSFAYVLSSFFESGCTVSEPYHEACRRNECEFPRY
jgi:hypothetical protein